MVNLLSENWYLYRGSTLDKLNIFVWKFMKAVVFDIIFNQILTMVTTLYLGILEAILELSCSDVSEPKNNTLENFKKLH